MLCATLVFALRDQVGLLGAALTGFVVVVLASSADVPTVLAAAWCVTALSADPPPFALALVTICGALLGAVEALAEARTGTVIIAMCLITLLTRERRLRQLPIFFACLVVTTAALWFATGQTLSNLPDFATNGLQIISGYSEAMGLPAGGRLWLGVAVLIGLVAWAVTLTAPERRRQIGVGLVVGGVCFAVFKEAFVRADLNHTPTFFASILLLVAAARLSRRRLRVPVLVPLVILMIVNVALAPRPQLASFDPVTRVNQAFTQARMLPSPQRQHIVEAFASAFMVQACQLPASDVALLRGHTVHVDPWDTAAAWVYHLDWDATPAFQGYSAYTSNLDAPNARSLRATDGPQRILRENTKLVDFYHRDAGIDRRLGIWDPPAETRAMLCSFAPQQTSLRWEVLARVANRAVRRSSWPRSRRAPDRR